MAMYSGGLVKGTRLRGLLRLCGAEAMGSASRVPDQESA